MPDSNFTGDKKLPLKSPLAAPERALIEWLTPRFTKHIEGYHLTLMTIIWSIGAVACGWLARGQVMWLLSGIVFQLAQWFTDSLDGSLGRYRDTGIPKWGYYMDHFLDYIFLCAGITGLAMLLDGTDRFMMMAVMPIAAGFMVSSYLAFSSTGQFKITFLGIGPTELRLFMIIIYGLVIMSGTAIISKPLPYLLVFLSIGLCVVVYRTQKYIWKIDMSDKASRADSPNKESSVVSSSDVTVGG
ncbi:hypothetical protein CHISP_2446 [Chitinispirillum alkaliphilum]|nr:hypothetical protein CHISP_2446 [Chitinispirillum alkaliphilum]